MNTDRIEKKIVLKSPRARVWRAISNAAEFGTWFGMEIEGDFAAGKHVKGKIRPTEVDPEVAKMQEPHAGAPCDLWIEEIVPETKLSYRWNPGVPEPGADLSREPTTLVVFTLADAPGGTLLTIVESGFDALPAEKRETARKQNDGGWEAQTHLVEKYLARA